MSGSHHRKFGEPLDFARDKLQANSDYHHLVPKLQFGNEVQGREFEVQPLGCHTLQCTKHAKALAPNILSFKCMLLVFHQSTFQNFYSVGDGWQNGFEIFLHSFWTSR